MKRITRRWWLFAFAQTHALYRLEYLPPINMTLQYHPHYIDVVT